MPDYQPDTTPYLAIPLPSPDAPSQRDDVARIREALIRIDEAIEDQEILSLALGE